MMVSAEENRRRISAARAAAKEREERPPGESVGDQVVSQRPVRKRAGESEPMPEFNRRLNLLFLEHRRPDGREWTCREVVEAIERKWGFKMSWTHLAHLKRGVATNPTRNVVVGLARFFGVPVAYLLEEEEPVALETLTLHLLKTDAELLDLTQRLARLTKGQRSAVSRVLQAFTDEPEELGGKPA